MRLFLTTLICLFTVYSFAQPGTLDSSFGANGKVTTFNSSGYFFPYDAAIQQDGKLLFAGNGSLTVDNGITGGMFALRYNADGTIDSSFGNNGRIEHGFEKFYPQCNTMCIQKDQKIILAGRGATNPYVDADHDSVLITRLKPDGSVDSSFGIYGEVITSVGGKGEAPLPNDVIEQADGKILVAGSRGPDFLILRYTPEGKLDMSFGGTGFIYTDFTQGIAYITAITLQPDGKIIAAGKAGEWAALVRYLPDGTLDESFGKNGKALETFNADFPYFTSVILNKDGSILTAGVLGGFESSMLVAKFTTEGKLDNSFSTDGSILLNTESLQSKAVNIVLQDDNKIILTGSAFDNLKINKEVLVLWRLIDNGTIDSTFGGNGQTTTDFGKEYGEQPFASFLYNGKIITSGVTGNSIDGKIATLLARYNNDELSKKQIIITKIKRWLQHRNGFTWDNNNNVNSYVIQRSYDGIHFSSVSKTNARNSSNTYADPSPLSGNNYYRLQTTSANGDVNYSNVIAVTADEVAVTISPNPAKNILQIQSLPADSHGAKLTVVDFTGNIKLQAVANNASYNLNIASLTTGNYLLKIEMNGEVITKKFLKE